jgi:tRNA-2-methylthio-N6-dimethylallyladenosine synthase
MMQQEHRAEKIRKSFRHVDIVFGPHALWRFPEFIERILTEKGVSLRSKMSRHHCRGDSGQTGRHGKAWLSVMYGCNNFCSYCIVPYVRGRERSRLPKTYWLSKGAGGRWV